MCPKKTGGLKPAVENPYIDENNCLTQPFDIVYPEVFESEEVTYSNETVMIKFRPGFDGQLTGALKDSGVAKLELMYELESGIWYLAYLAEGTEVTEAVPLILQHTSSY